MRSFRISRSALIFLLLILNVCPEKSLLILSVPVSIFKIKSFIMIRHLKRIIILTGLFVISSRFVQAQEHKLIKKWESDTILKVPESDLYDAENKVLYVSN